MGFLRRTREAADVPFAKDQPKDGDTILHCGHIHQGSLHWFKYEGGPVRFIRPDKTSVTAEWYVACDACFIKHGEKVARFPRGDEIWNGDDPIIKELVKS
jgi:hypothetical protein